MGTTLKKITQEFNELNLIKVFEIEVIDKKTNEEDYILFNISIDKNNLIAQHIALNKEEEESRKISFKSIEIDTDFSLDEHIQELYEKCMYAISESDFFELLD